MNDGAGGGGRDSRGRNVRVERARIWNVLLPSPSSRVVYEISLIVVPTNKYVLHLFASVYLGNLAF